MPAVENRQPGWRSIDPRSKRPARVAVPSFITDAPTIEATVARGRAAEALPLPELSLQERCDLLEQAQAAVEDLSSSDRRKLDAALAKRDAIVVPSSPHAGPRSTLVAGKIPAPGSPGTDPGDLLERYNDARRTKHRLTGEIDALAHNLAGRVVKTPGDLRVAVAYLLANPISPISED